MSVDAFRRAGVQLYRYGTYQNEYPGEKMLLSLLKIVHYFSIDTMLGTVIKTWLYL